MESGTNESPSLEGGRGPEASYLNSRPEDHESDKTPPSYATTNEMKQAPSLSQQTLNEPEPTLNNAEAGLTGLNERPNYKEDSEGNRKPSSSEPDNINTKAMLLYEGSDMSAMNLGPRYPGSEIIDMKARPSYASLNPTETKTRPGIGESSSAKETSSYERQEEKDARLETFASLPMNDKEPPKNDKLKIDKPKSDKPPSLAYVAPQVAKTPKKPADTPIKLPPALALITPKRGIIVILYRSLRGGFQTHKGRLTNQLPLFSSRKKMELGGFRRLKAQL